MSFTRDASSVGRWMWGGKRRVCVKRERESVCEEGEGEREGEGEGECV